MKFKLGETQLHISNFIVVVPPLLCVIGSIGEYAAAFVSIALHELGHLAVARLYGCKTGIIRIMPVGLSVSVNDGGCSRAGLIKIYSAGPAVNLLILLISVLAFALFPKAGHFWELIAATNAILALFNLIPAFPLDGGRILLELLAGSMGLLAAGRLISRLALVLAFILLTTGILQLFSSGYNFSLILIGIYMMILWKNGKVEGALMNIRQIIYRRTRLMKKGLYPARDLVVLRSTRLDETLNNMDFDRFHLIYLLDDDLKLLRIFTENEIMAAISKGEGTTFGQIFDGLMGNLDN